MDDRRPAASVDQGLYSIRNFELRKANESNGMNGQTDHRSANKQGQWRVDGYNRRFKPKRWIDDV